MTERLQGLRDDQLRLADSDQNFMSQFAAALQADVYENVARAFGIELKPWSPT